MADFGSYECKASNILGHDSAWTRLSVFQLPRFTKTPPAQLFVEKNKRISVLCQATGHSPPKITWLKERGNLPVGRSLVSHDGTLQILNTKKEDSGTYICTATSNIMHKAVTGMKLTIGGESTLYVLIRVLFVVITVFIGIIKTFIIIVNNNVILNIIVIVMMIIIIIIIIVIIITIIIIIIFITCYL